MIKFFLPIGIAIAALLGLGFFIYHDASAPATETENEGSASTTTQVIETEFGDVVAEVSGEGKANVQITKTPASAGPPAPSLDRPYHPPADLPPEIKVEMQETYSHIVGLLRENRQNVMAWLELGTYRGNAGDHEGAVEVWIYVTKIAPQHHLAYANLGNTYEFNLNDYAKAEAYYLKAIAVNPKSIATYRSLLDLYAYRYQQGSVKAEGILLEGIAKNPDNTDLLISLAQHYRDAGKIEQARGRYLEARALAEAAGNTSLVVAIDAEVAEL